MLRLLGFIVVMNVVVISYHTDRRIREIILLVQEYKNRHSARSLKEESHVDICKRKFVKSSRDLSCNWAGNSIGSHLSAMLAGIVLNRTYFTNHFVACDGAMELKSWVPLQNEVEALTKSAGCPIDFRTDFGSASTECAIAESNRSLFMYSDIHNTAYDYFHPKRGIPLTEDMHQRASILFSSRDRFEAYGLLQRYAYTFPNITQSLALSILNKIYGPNHARHAGASTLASMKQLQNVLTIGVHLRHPDGSSVNNSELDLPFDSNVEKAIQKIRSYDKTSNCMVLIASDRAESILRVENYAKNASCTAAYIERNLNASPDGDKGYEEHGPWSKGAIAIADWYLLTHSMYFIGSHGSTYSALIANAVAFQSSFRGNTGNHTIFTWISPGDTSDIFRSFGNCTCTAEGIAIWDYIQTWPAS